MSSEDTQVLSDSNERPIVYVAIVVLLLEFAAFVTAEPKLCDDIRFSGEPWTSFDGRNCTDFVNDYAVSGKITACRVVGNNALGLTAGAACCGCGGGTVATPSFCVNLIGSDGLPWTGAYKNTTCAWPFDHDTNFCDHPISLETNDEGVSAKVACCSCGGGNFSLLDRTTTLLALQNPGSLTSVTQGDLNDEHADVWTAASSNTKCIDLQVHGRPWRGFDGNGCDFYHSANLTLVPPAIGCIGVGHSSSGLTAASACCICGGGSTSLTLPMLCTDITNSDGSPWHQHDKSGTTFQENTCADLFNVIPHACQVALTKLPTFVGLVALLSLRIAPLLVF